jgi:DNA repair protein RecO (recombination protein O)
MPAGAALFAGFYLNELLLKLLARQDAHAALFDVYADALASLQGSDDSSVQVSLRSFELALLRELGVLPELDSVTLTVRALEPEGRYTLHPESGIVAAAAGEGAVPGRALALIEAALASGNGAALRSATAPVTAALRGPLRQVLHYHLGSPQLRTRQVMADLRKLIDSETARP